MNYNHGAEQGDKDLFHFLANSPKEFREGEKIRKYQLKNGDYIHCVLWNMHFYITGTDIVKVLVWRFQNAGRQIASLKKFEEGVFSDLRNLKPGIDATLEGPRSEFLEFLYKNGCIRTQKKQKVFFWYSVPHDALFCDALERDLRRETNLYTYSKYMCGVPSMHIRPHIPFLGGHKKASKLYRSEPAKFQEEKRPAPPRPDMLPAPSLSKAPGAEYPPLGLGLFGDAPLSSAPPAPAFGGDIGMLHGESSYSAHIQQFIQPASSKNTGLVSEYNFNELDFLHDDTGFMDNMFGSDSSSFLSQGFDNPLLFEKSAKQGSCGLGKSEPCMRESRNAVDEMSFVNPKKIASITNNSGNCQR